MKGVVPLRVQPKTTDESMRRKIKCAEKVLDSILGKEEGSMGKIAHTSFMNYDFNDLKEEMKQEQVREINKVRR